jgi:hypothetical protein
MYLREAKALEYIKIKPLCEMGLVVQVRVIGGLTFGNG